MRPPRSRRIVLAGVLLGFLLPPAGSAEPVPTTADTLFEEGDWGGSITEYKRFIFHHPSSSYHDACLVGIGEAHRNQGNWDGALTYFKRARHVSGTDSLIQERRLDEAVTFELRGNPLTAELEYARLYAFGRNEAVKERAAVLLTLSQVRGRRWDEARESLGAVKGWSTNQRDSRLDSLFRAGDAKRRPSPRKARMLSTFLPGLGQAYAGSITGALHALLLNGLFATLFGKSVDDGHFGEAAFVYLPLFHRYYMGNRESAARVAVEEYRNNTEPFVVGIQTEIRSEFVDRR